jgi:hypothetical protein
MRTYTCSGLAPGEELMIRAAMQMASRIHAHGWHFVAPTEQAIDVAFTLANGSDTTHALLRVEVIDDDARTVSASSAHSPSDTNEGVSYLVRPLRSMLLLDLAKQLDADLGGSASATNHAGNSSPTHGATMTERLRQLVRATKGLGRSQIRLDTGVVEVDPAQAHFRTSLDTDALIELFENSARFDIEQIASHNASYAPSREETVPLAIVCWRLASKHLLAVHCDWLHATHTAKLTQWPDFGLLGANGEAMRMSAAMVRQPMTAEALSTACNVQLPSVHRFMNACAASGYLQHTDDRAQPAIATKAGEQTSKKRGLLSRITQKLGLMR